jgi:branched-chain amino acid transport system substrate-binding protein
MNFKKTLLALAITATAGTAAFADVKIGVSLSLTGPGSGLGIPMQKQLTLFPKTIGGEKVELIILDDASDPGKAAANARRFVTDDKVDVIFGANLTPTSAAVVPIAFEAKTAQVSGAPVPPQGDKESFLFRLPQGFEVMAHAVVEHMKKQGVKTVGFLGYADGYGQGWLASMGPMLDKAGIKMVDVERFARTDTSVTPQALKLTAANPDAILVVASGSGAAMPQLALAERGYKGKVYQTHAAATPDLMRIGGKTVEGTFVVSGPALLGDQLPDSHPSKKQAINFVTNFEKANGANSRNQFAGHAYDFQIAMEKVIPMALKTCQAGYARIPHGYP